MELIGIPMRITVGKLAGENKVEFRKRTDTQNTILTAEEAVEQVLELCR
jgi:prolyl-tRNA synthetase